MFVCRIRVCAWCLYFVRAYTCFVCVCVAADLPITMIVLYLDEREHRHSHSLLSGVRVVSFRFVNTRDDTQQLPLHCPHPPTQRNATLVKHFVQQVFYIYIRTLNSHQYHYHHAIHNATDALSIIIMFGNFGLGIEERKARMHYYCNFQMHLRIDYGFTIFNQFIDMESAFRT